MKRNIQVARSLKATCILALLCTAFSPLHAQNVFPAAGNTGIGTTSPSSNLQILHQSGYDCGGGLSGGGGGGTYYPLLPISPAVRIDDNNNNSSSLSAPGHNIFEIWHSMSFCPSTSPVSNNLQFSIFTGDGGSKVAVNKPVAFSTLDVGGNMNADGNLALQGGQIDMTMSGYDAWRNINANSGIGGLTISSGNGGAYQQFHAAYESDPGAMTITCGDNGTGTTFLSTNATGTTWKYLMRIKPNGQVAIGGDIITPENLPNSTDYNLYVSKGILTEKLKVALTASANWADFVFNKDYSLMPLSEVETYVNANKHLPEIPSATEIVQSGIDVATMDAKLLQKVEELTLYIIKQQKEIDEQKIAIKQLLKKQN